jgi:uncharacterized RDD family membrane protein YckC
VKRRWDPAAARFSSHRVPPDLEKLGMLLAVGLSVADVVPVITDQRLRQALHDRFAGTVVIKAP